MKIILILLVFISTICCGQSKADIKDFLKEKVEAGEPLDNYKYTLAFSDDLLKIHAETFVGQQISEAQFQNLFFFATEIYLTNKKNQLLVEIINSGDFEGVKKVSTTKSREKGIDFYTIIVYMREGFIGTKYTDTAENLEKIPLALSCDANTAQSIKKAFIKLAELSGAKNVIDGDDLFSTK